MYFGWCPNDTREKKRIDFAFLDCFLWFAVWFYSPQEGVPAALSLVLFSLRRKLCISLVFCRRRGCAKRREDFIFFRRQADFIFSSLLEEDGPQSGTSSSCDLFHLPLLVKRDSPSDSLLVSLLFLKNRLESIMESSQSILLLVHQSQLRRRQQQQRRRPKILQWLPLMVLNENLF